MSIERKLQVGVKAFLKNSEGKYLLLHRNKKKYPEVKELWDIVGGRINPGIPLMENLQREICEETQLKLNLNKEIKLIDAQDILINKNKHIVRLTYIAEIDGKVILDKTENDKYQWLTEKEINQIPEKDLGYYMNETFKKYFLKNGPDGIRTRDT